MPAAQVVRKLERAGYALAVNSEYLRTRNWIQISLMGQPSVDRLRDLLEALRLVCWQTVV